MKLIIDIPEEVLTAIQNGEDYRYDLHTTIAQGIPYEPNGDLISRKALKQMMPAPIEDEYKRVHQIIDNAPTVERPQGEWKPVEGYDGDEYYECSNCGEPWVLNEGTPEENNMHFCPNCGADMRKGGAE